jgi:hypothetical protein
MIRWPHRVEARHFEPRIRVKTRLLELETSKQIHKEIFHTRPSDIEDMIQRRLEERR